jgi:cytidylate kinase
VIVAIDGPAGSGKSTTARRVAERVGWLYLDTGAMYRAAGLAFLREGAPFTAEAAARLMPGTTVDLAPAGDDLRVSLNGEDVTVAIRTPEASRAASRAATLAPVRAQLVEAQRRIARREVAAGRGVVLEGRDIGTVVFPDADVKFFLTADLAARARRRHAELAERALAAGAEAPAFDAVEGDLDARDRRDAGRTLAPLRPAEDAVVLDTTALSVEEQVERVLDAIHAVLRVRGGAGLRARPA